MNTRAAIFTLGLMLSGAAITAPAAHAQLFGESDEEKAARQAHEDGQDNQISQLSGRVQQLEDRVRGLTQSLSTATGTNEELAHQIQELRQKIDAQQKDFAYRLCMVSAQQLGADGNEQGLNCNAVGAGPAASAPPSGGGYTPGAPLPPLGGSDPGFNNPPPGGSQQFGRPPGNLGTLPMNSGPMNNGPGNGAMNAPPPRAAAPVGGTAQYDRAMNLLAKAQYIEASAAFRAYADANPNDTDLSAQSIYWIGNIAYVQKNYPDATRAFAEQLKKYPDSIRSPDSMLKLGQALIAQGQTSSGCTTLAALKTKYPKTAPATLAAAAGARKAACR